MKKDLEETELQEKLVIEEQKVIMEQEGSEKVKYWVIDEEAQETQQSE